MRFPFVTFARLALAVIVNAVNVSAQTPANQRDAPVPSGFAILDDAFWQGPWVFRQRGTQRAEWPRLHVSMGAASGGPVPIRLDDGSTGTLRVDSRPCGASDNCEPFDCGCPLDDESFWIEVANAAGQRVARLHLWAAYGTFDIVPIDLVDGAGDELVIVRIPAHSAPPIGPDLKIWKPGPTAPIVLAEPLRVAGYLTTAGGGAIPCARWRVRLLVDPAAAKPRAIQLQADLAASVDSSDPASICRLDREGTDAATALKRGELLRLQGARYRFRAERGVAADFMRAAPRDGGR